ncbi:MAG TPA: RIP metalloprotease RseP [Gammaproteobacteria bacterium]|nr:RIP metalloprotease RseP [Gammaproteobacteria bacterium]
MSTFFSSAFFFIVALGVLITVHEFGHFWVARRLGVKVLRFSIGFGKPLWTWRRKNDETEYVIAALPLGGYVQMLDEREGPVEKSELHLAFNRKPLASRFAIVAAGPLFNFLLAFILYWLMFVIGIPGVKPIIGEVEPGSIAAQGGFRHGDTILRIDGKEVATWNSAFMTLIEKSLDGGIIRVEVRDEPGKEQLRILDLNLLPEGVDKSNVVENLGFQRYMPAIPPVIGGLEAGGAAEQAGLQPGDHILSADGTPIKEWRQWVDVVREHPGQVMQVEVEREGRVLQVELKPAEVQTEEGTFGRIGAAVDYPEEMVRELEAVERHSIGGSLVMAAHRTWDMTILTGRMLWEMIAGDVAITNIGGPISIAQYAGYSASIGFISFIGFLALISISLGVLNLLPIPILDGGHLLYYVIEFFKGSPVSEATQAMGQRVGIVILLGVMVLAFYNDLVQVFNS